MIRTALRTLAVLSLVVGVVVYAQYTTTPPVQRPIPLPDGRNTFPVLVNSNGVVYFPTNVQFSASGLSNVVFENTVLYAKTTVSNMFFSTRGPMIFESYGTNGLSIGQAVGGGNLVTGSGIKIGWGGGADNECLAVGNGAAAINYGTSIGDQCDAFGLYSIGIGKSVELQPENWRSIVICSAGTYAPDGWSNTIVIGSATATSDNMTVIGQSSPNTTKTVLMGRIVGNGAGITNVSGTNLILYTASGGHATVLPDDMKLADSSGQLSVEWDTRSLDKADSSSVLNWGNQQLLGAWSVGAINGGPFTNGSGYYGNGIGLTNQRTAYFTYSEPAGVGGVGISVSTNAWTVVPLNATNFDSAGSFSVTSTNTLLVQSGADGVWSIRANMQIFETSTCTLRLRRKNNTAATLILGNTGYNDAASVITSSLNLEGVARLSAGDVIALESVAENAVNQMGTANINTSERAVYSQIVLERK